MRAIASVTVGEDWITCRASVQIEDGENDSRMAGIVAELLAEVAYCGRRERDAVMRQVYRGPAEN